jgi:phosphoenolpyruvate carboxylase
MGTMAVDNTAALLMPTSAKQLLRDDDSLLRQMFFNVLRHHHPNTANKVDVIYALSQAWCTSREDGDFELLEKYLDALKPDECILVSVLRGIT